MSPMRIPNWMSRKSSIMGTNMNRTRRLPNMLVKIIRIQARLKDFRLGVILPGRKRPVQSPFAFAHAMGNVV